MAWWVCSRDVVRMPYSLRSNTNASIYALALALGQIGDPIAFVEIEICPRQKHLLQSEIQSEIRGVRPMCTGMHFFHTRKETDMLLGTFIF
jgi:hypothetical protein